MGSEMCIRDSLITTPGHHPRIPGNQSQHECRHILRNPTVTNSTYFVTGVEVCVGGFVDKSGGDGWSRACSPAVERCTHCCRVDLFGARFTKRAFVHGRNGALAIDLLRTKQSDLNNLAFSSLSRSLLLLVTHALAPLRDKRRPVTHGNFEGLFRVLFRASRVKA